MKRFLLIISFIIFALAGLGQTDGMNYQAVIIDNDPQEIPGIDVEGNYLSESEVRLRFTIFNDEGDFEYQEIQQATTDKYGMISLIIGQGEVTEMSSGAFNQIDWDGTPKQLYVELSYSGAEFQEFSEQELLFLPFVYHRNITATGTLEVDGSSTLNDSLTVENGSPTLLTGDLTVQGDGDFEGETYFNIIHVENESFLNGDVFVEGTTLLNNSLTVGNESPTLLTGDLNVEGISTFDGDSYFNTITVENESHLQGTLEVDSTTTLKNNFNVLLQSPSYLSGSLLVDEDATFNSAFEVLNGSPSYLSGSLEVDGTSNFYGALSVYNQSSTLLTGQLTVQGNTFLNNQLVVNNATDLNGQVTISSNQEGEDDNYDIYPLRVEGSNQGIAVKVDGTRNRSNNYVTFIDDEGIQGRIEGQTLDEPGWQYLFELYWMSFETGFAAGEALACVLHPFPDAAEAAYLGAGAVAIAVAQGVYIADYATNIGVTYESGGADYAEWLEREDEAEDLHPGEVVGVRAGKISKNTDNADQILAISTKPIVLGNLPEEGREDKYEKVAFLGQVPVRVAGSVNEGDYILPSGSNNGLAVAVNPEELPTSLFHKIIGISWESGPRETVNMVNVAIGLNANVLANRVAKMETELNDLKSEVAQIKNELNGTSEQSDDSAFEAQEESIPTIPNQFAKRIKNDPGEIELTDEEFEHWLNTYGHVFEARISALKDKLDAQGINYRHYDDIAMLIDEPIESMRKMRSGEFMSEMWPDFARKMKNHNKE